MLGELQRQVVDPNPTHTLNLISIEDKITHTSPYQYVIILVLRNAVCKRCPIHKEANFAQSLGVTSQLFVDTSIRCIEELLASPRMRAARVRPKSRGVILAQGAPCQKHLGAPSTIP
jgi:hypothetical protein